MISEQSEQSEASVVILMGTFNGERFLAEQLDSIKSQSHSNWRLIVSDDGSTDKTVELLYSYQNDWGPNRLEIRQGPRDGFCRNFISMASDSTVEADYYAFSDQDDIWFPEKLAVALTALKPEEINEYPLIYCGRSLYVTEMLKPCGESQSYVFPKMFRNALVQSIAGGNTMVFNRTAKHLLEKAGPICSTSHDWWTYQLVTGAGGKVVFDLSPYILYRQHPEALIGKNTSITAKLERLTMVMKGQFRQWNELNVEALNQVRYLLTDDSCETLDLFMKLRHASLRDRMRLLGVAGLYRQTKKGTLSLIFATIFGKV